MLKVTPEAAAGDDVIVVDVPGDAVTVGSAQFVLTRPTHQNQLLEAVSETGVEREVDDGVVAGVRHGEPVGAQPDHVDVFDGVEV